MKRQSVYITTGNNYGVPPSVTACATAAGSDLAALAACEPQGNGNYVDAILSLDLATGAIKWANKMQGYDAWTTACFGFPTACPTPQRPDFDFSHFLPGCILWTSPVIAKPELPHVGSRSGVAGLQGNPWA